MNEISSLPSLNELLGQNPNLRPNAQASNFARNFESQLGANGQSSANINAISPVAIDKTTPTDRVNAPGFANMFENFIKGSGRQKENSQKLPHKILSLVGLIIYTKLWSNRKKQVLRSI
jgi:hypothetical protein